MAREGWHTITPRLFVDDPSRLVAFLVDVFGAQGELSKDDKPTTLRIGDSNLMIGSTEWRRATSSLLKVYVDDVDATYARAIAAGATSLEEPADMPWGDRRAMIADQFGTDWQIATPLEP
ncbi:MAG: VOC family protein [Candidatus Eremiobacteraeota bacterium]|nr:VOC family protein [Candidatus Eremiobacteraeota bacterium]